MESNTYEQILGYLPALKMIANSQCALQASVTRRYAETNVITNTTAGWAFRIVDFVDAPGSAVGDAYTDVIVKFNPGSHSYTNQTGI